jgi:hypothetical protein
MMSGPVRVEQFAVLPAARLEGVWVLYQRAFGPLAGQAASRHVLDRAGFRAQMVDPSVIKLVVHQDDQPVSLLTLTFDVDTVSWVSADFYRARYPTEAAGGNLMYITNMLTDPVYVGSAAFLLITEALNALLPLGAVGFDICGANVDRGLATALHRRLLALRGGAGDFEELDTQIFYGLRVW